MSKVLYFSLLIVLSASASLSRFEDVLLMAKKSGDMSKYLKPTKNCQVNDKSIQSKAKSLSSGSEREKAEKVNSNTQLYKQAGNSIVVDVLEKIFRNLLEGE